MSSSSQADVDLLRSCVQPLKGDPSDFDSLLQLVKERNAEFVLLGEASHGTHEFYKVRAEITKRLIKEQGFTAVCIEADWPDAMRLNRYVKGEQQGKDKDASEALDSFKRFPQWMWRNADVLDFIGWLRQHNTLSHSTNLPLTSIYGLDLYSLHSSILSVLSYLHTHLPSIYPLARDRYSCFDRFGEDTQRYGYLAGLGITETCERECVGVVKAIAKEREGVLMKGGEDALFDAEMNAKVVRDAENYYRQMFREDVSSWNLRDTHIATTLTSIRTHLSSTSSSPPKLIVWAHNSHLGNAKATSMGARGEHNVGQLVREKYGDRAVLVGFTTYEGTVTAASEWDSPAELKQVRPALPGSWELLFHSLPFPSFSLITSHPSLTTLLSKPRLERAIGVIYRPQTERQSHYFKADLQQQFDVLLHYDRTRGVEPLERKGEWMEGEVEETWPSGL